MSSEFKIINPLCNDETIRGDLNEAYQRMMRVPYTDNVVMYFQNLVQSLQGTGVNFLANAECLSTYCLLEEVMIDGKHFNISNEINIDLIKDSVPGGVVLQMCIASPFAEYHYLTAVTSPNLDFVDIYQSYGCSVRFRTFRISMEEFNRSLNLLSQIYESVATLKKPKNNLTKNQKYEHEAIVVTSGIEIENTLNQLQLRNYVQNMNRVVKKEDEEDEDEEEEEEEEIHDPELEYILRMILSRFPDLTGVITFENIEQSLTYMIQSHKAYIPIIKICTPLPITETTSSSKGRLRRTKRTKKTRKSRRKRRTRRTKTRRH
jgi:hypothetical protein